MLSVSQSNPTMQEQLTLRPQQQQQQSQSQSQSLTQHHSQRTKTQYACMYTHHKTQKRKIWQDGRLVIIGIRAELYTACPKLGAEDSMLDAIEIMNTAFSFENHLSSSIIETEKFLIEIQGPWQSQNPIRSVCQPQQQAPQPLISNGMKKLLNKKFQKPQSYVPPKYPQPNNSATTRKRPLQPGELVRQYYGNEIRSQSSLVEPFSSMNRYQQSPSHVPPMSETPLHFQQSASLRPPPETCELNRHQAITTMPENSQSNENSHDYTKTTTNVHSSHSMVRSSWDVSVHTTVPTQRTITTQNDHSNRTTTIFSCQNNGFQASQFYGEEEDDEEQEEEKEEYSREVFSFGLAQPLEHPQAQQSLSKSTGDCSDRLSTSQLLDLFGGGGKSNADTTNDDFVLPPDEDSDDDED